MSIRKFTLLTLASFWTLAGSSEATIYYRLNMGGSLPGTGTCPNGDFAWHSDSPYGTVLRVRVFDVSSGSSERCEFVAGGSNDKYRDKTVYMGWRSWLNLPTPTSTDWNNLMQGKAHGSFTYNYPFYLRGDSGTLRFVSNQKGLIWSRSLPLRTWYKLLIKIRYSTSESYGYAELWYNGSKQTLTNGSQQYKFVTYSGSDNNVHWGLYRTSRINGTGYHYIWRPTIASTYEEANPPN